MSRIDDMYIDWDANGHPTAIPMSQAQIAARTAEREARMANDRLNQARRDVLLAHPTMSAAERETLAHRIIDVEGDITIDSLKAKMVEAYANLTPKTSAADLFAWQAGDEANKIGEIAQEATVRNGGLPTDPYAGNDTLRPVK